MSIKAAAALTGLVLFGVNLSGCGGGDGGKRPTEAKSEPHPDTAVVSTVSGRVADGYLDNARVCLDIDNSGSCDTSEPVTYTGSRGGYSFRASESEAANASVRVSALQNLTLDRDTGKTITDDYELTAPVGVFDFISPFTTLVALEMERGGESRQAVEKDLQRLLGTRADLFADFIQPDRAALDLSDAGAYQQLHQIARILVALGNQASRASTAYERQQAGLDDERARRQIWLQMRDILPTVSSAVKSAATAPDQFRLESATQGLEGLVTGDAGTLRDREFAERALAQVQQGDFYSTEARVSQVIVHSGSGPVTAPLARMSMSSLPVSGGLYPFDRGVSTFEPGTGWTELEGVQLLELFGETASTAGTHYFPSSAVWSGVADPAGKLVKPDSSEIAFGYDTQMADLGSQPVRRLVSGLGLIRAFPGILDDNALFAPGSKLYAYREHFAEGTLVYPNWSGGSEACPEGAALATSLCSAFVTSAGYQDSLQALFEPLVVVEVIPQTPADPKEAPAEEIDEEGEENVGEGGAEDPETVGDDAVNGGVGSEENVGNDTVGTESGDNGDSGDTEPGSACTDEDEAGEADQEAEPAVNEDGAGDAVEEKDAEDKCPKTLTRYVPKTFSLQSEKNGDKLRQATLAGKLEDGSGLILIYEYDTTTSTFGTQPALLGRWTYNDSIRPHLALRLPTGLYVDRADLNGEEVLAVVGQTVRVGHRVPAGQPLWREVQSRYFFNEAALDSLRAAWNPGGSAPD